MNLSYREIKSWLSNVDYTIIGSGIVGLNCALNLKNKFQKSKILILEKGSFPQGGSTKNAGFACFGSATEIINDLRTHNEKEVVELIKKRQEGLKNLRKLIGDKSLNYKQVGGFEIFPKKDLKKFEDCESKLSELNKILKPLFNYNVFEIKTNNFGFENIVNKVIYNQFEGQLDPGKMIENFLQIIKKKNIKILNNINVKSFVDNNNSVEVFTENFSYKTSKLFIATNGFSNMILDEDVKPARAQVLITKPIDNLKIKGTFHFDRGYYYFRNIDNRILIGGGRNLDFKNENTSEFGLTKKVQDELNRLLKEVVLPGYQFEIDKRWSGIMGVGAQKKPIINQFTNNVFVGARMGGMGVAIGCSVGKKLSEIIYS